MAEKQVEAAERERIRAYAECAMSHINRISEIVFEKLGPDLGDGPRGRIAAIRLRRSAQQSGPESVADRQADGIPGGIVVPEVLVFEDENGVCLGMYIDPPGICTDEC